MSQHLGEQVVLGLEVAVHRPEGHVGLGRHVLHLYLGVVVVAQKRQTGLHDPVTALALRGVEGVGKGRGRHAGGGSLGH